MAASLIEEDADSYYSILKQGSGLANLDGALNSTIAILMTGTAVDGEARKDVTSYSADGKASHNKSGKKEISIEKRIYIQGHIGKINTIEIDKRLGVIMTSGDDNYIFIRKIFDFELLMPIKIKNKYKILTMKISSYNFLYIICLNKTKKENNKIIFGYTLSGMKFAKSAYGLYDNISINEDGDIVTMDETKNMILLSGSDLTKLNIAENTNYQNVLNDIKISNWLQYDCFYRNEEEKMAKILTYFSEQVNGYFIKTTSFSDL